ncbi:hypothetical protein P9E76_01345 [Schinkia azotoformans]|uniref:Lipoprotein n=1 Tax=Schinkia azotoformans LMG 9581 TaxID=1131731 RepID=K6E2W6_SCHAZ|nr:hypothetical protein [Schinkia azotoformans]EKN67521.1 hypothetical protein BAZO_08526 [Schinkia azotoformans LMG 9581]MEC1637318.1 hypothetical protein [Schinkia azotoformans]MEC1943722.1 hypothetical protein [Schinkia azotoformans]
MNKIVILLIGLSILVVGCSSQNTTETSNNTSTEAENIRPDKEKADQLAKQALKAWDNKEFIQAKELFEESLKYHKNLAVEEWLDDDIKAGVNQMNNAKEYSQFIEVNSKVNKADFTTFVSISGSIKNKGEKTITDGLLKLYYLDESGNRIGEELMYIHPVADAIDIKPNYLGDFIAEVPDSIKANWNEKYEVQLHSLVFDGGRLQ